MLSVTRFLLCLVFFGHSLAFAGAMIGKVVGVTDGDTITLLVNGHDRYKVRLEGIDAPEKRQPYYQQAKQKLSDLTYREMVTVEFTKRDRYGRIVGKILRSDQDINLQMIESGLAWHYKKYAREQNPEDRTAYAQAELEARFARRGLWQDPAALAPWEYRASKP